MHKWTMFILVCAACLLGLTVLFAAIPEEQQSADEGGNTVEVTLDADAAKAVYARSCLSCHGDQLQGSGSIPALDQVGSALSKEEIMRRIELGKGMMPGFKGTLSAQEIANLSLWLSEMK